MIHEVIQLTLAVINDDEYSCDMKEINGGKCR